MQFKTSLSYLSKILITSSLIATSPVSLAVDQLSDKNADFNSLAIVGSNQAAAGRAGDLDTSFSLDGKYTFSFDIAPTLWDEAKAVIPRAGGGYLVVGHLYSGGDIGFIALTDAGVLDTSFGVGGKIIYDSGLLDIQAVTVDNQNRIILVGNSRKANATILDFDPMVCRFNANAFPDPIFGGNGCRLYPVDIFANGQDTVSAVTTDGGAIYLAGQAQFNAEDFDMLAMKIDANDADLNTFFGGDGIQTYAFDVDSVHPGGDADGALAIVRLPNEASLVLGGFARNEAPFGNDYAFAKIDVVAGSLVTAFCQSAALCGQSEIFGGRRSVILSNASGNDDQIVEAMTVDPNGNVVVAGQDYLFPNAGETQAQKLTRINPVTGLDIGGQTFNSVFKYADISSMVTDASGNIYIAGVSSVGTGNVNDPNRSLFLSKYLPNLQSDNTFADFFGPTATALVVFAKSSAAEHTDHKAGQITIDSSGRILMAGGRLWQQNVPTNIFDYDFSVFRLQGATASSGDAVFRNGFEN